MFETTMLFWRRRNNIVKVTGIWLIGYIVLMTSMMFHLKMLDISAISRIAAVWDDDLFIICQKAFLDIDGDIMVHKNEFHPLESTINININWFIKMVEPWPTGNYNHIIFISPLTAQRTSDCILQKVLVLMGPYGHMYLGCMRSVFSPPPFLYIQMYLVHFKTTFVCGVSKRSKQPHKCLHFEVPSSRVLHTALPWWALACHKNCAVTAKYLKYICDDKA